ncbi:DNA methylase N-4/N-6 [uncultured Caudovirales phage]|uniref:DNA methylase N-4/N-6 n=1 Tax=uncultured Caudovirales phage TaxID=2100421 RepID=A0A6J5N8U3_9CAUD|nr:DNA methylase N-4/N-6 [uncultured Caudovirales phage]
MPPHTLHLGDNLAALRAMPDNSVDSIVTDPPYGLSFMGKKWDYDVPSVELWQECLRVLKPGGHLLAFAGTRTQHRMAVKIEDAGFEVRDMIAWVYGSGFPKSHNLKDDWQGWGTALKPALEPITVARKPLVGTVAENVQRHGTGALNIDGCRVEAPGEDCARKPALVDDTAAGFGKGLSMGGRGHDAGRWPANLIHDGSEEVVAGFPVTGASKSTPRNNGEFKSVAKGRELPHVTYGHDDDGGSAARFFYCAKASKADRGEENVHPTVKPTDLMRYLCRLVTPPGGVVLDPFMGSGSTGKAAMLEGFRFIGCELSEEYFKIADARISAALASQPLL